MFERDLLEFAHRGVRPVDSRLNLRPIAMFNLDRCGKTRVIAAQFQLHGLLAQGEPMLDLPSEGFPS